MVNTNSMQGRQIGEKFFGEAEQQQFASLSRDVNPLHMDADIARRLITGGKAVHGIHLLLTAIELSLKDSAKNISHIKCEFKNAVNVGSQAKFIEEQVDKGESVIHVTVDDLLATRLVLSYGDDSQVSEHSNADIDRESKPIGLLATPQDADPRDLLGKSFEIGLNLVDFEPFFPLATKHLGSRCLAEICSFSYFVGMVCPGLHSIFVSVDAGIRRDARPQGDVLSYSVNKFDSRSGLFEIVVNGANSVIHGIIRALQRPRPAEQPAMSDFLKSVAPGEFQESSSLVIGGSRGLGECVAKILAAGNGKVTITYRHGVEDAERVKAEIDSHKPNACEILKFDFLSDPIHSLKSDLGRFDSIYFFATPKIFRKKSDLFDRKTFDEFLQMYVVKFYEMCLYLEKNLERKIKIYFPSSVAIDVRPRDMVEYAMAKSSCEILSAEINKYFGRVSIMFDRLPRLATDQTATVVKVKDESPITILIPVVRAMRAAIDRG